MDWILHRCQVFLYGMLVVFGKNQKIYGMLVTCEWNGKWIKYSMYFKRINFIIHIKFYKFGEVGITMFYLDKDPLHLEISLFVHFMVQILFHKSNDI